MKRARKAKCRSQSASRLFNRLMVFGLCVLAVLVVFGLGTVSLRHQLAETANSIKLIEKKISEERRRSSELNVQLSRATTTQALLRLNSYMGLQLREPDYSQIVKVAENVEVRLYNKVARSLATAAADGQ